MRLTPAATAERAKKANARCAVVSTGALRCAAAVPLLTARDSVQQSDGPLWIGTSPGEMQMQPNRALSERRTRY